MTTVPPSNSEVNENDEKNSEISLRIPTYNIEVDTFEDAANWILKEAKKNHIEHEKARNHALSLRSLASALPDRPQTVAYLKEHLAEYLTPWQIMRATQRKTDNIETAKNYRSKAEWLLEQYTARCADPLNYNITKFLKAPSNSEDRSARTHTRVRTPKATPVQPQSEPETDDRAQVTCQFPEGLVTLTLPKTSKLTVNHISTLACQLAMLVDNFSVRDAGIIASHLATRGTDFDPMRTIADQILKAPPAA